MQKNETKKLYSFLLESITKALFFPGILLGYNSPLLWDWKKIKGVENTPCRHYLVVSMSFFLLFPSFFAFFLSWYWENEGEKLMNRKLSDLDYVRLNDLFISSNILSTIHIVNVNWFRGSNEKLIWFYVELFSPFWWYSFLLVEVKLELFLW